MPSPLPWEDTSHRPHAFNWSVPSEPIPLPSSSRPSRFPPPRRPVPEESRPAEEDERRGRQDRGYTPREPSRLSQASGASSSVSVAEEDLEGQLGESRDQVGSMRQGVGAQTHSRRGSHPQHATTHPGTVRERSRFVEIFDDDEDKEVEDDGEGEGEGQRTPTSGWDCTRPDGSGMEAGNDGSFNGTITNPFSSSFGAVGDVPVETVPNQSPTSSCQPKTPITAIHAPSNFWKHFGKAEAVLEGGRGVLSSDLSRRKFSLSPAEIEAQQADVCIGRRANRALEDGRTLLPGLPLSPDNPEDANPGPPTLPSRGERPFDSPSNRDAQTSPNTPEEMLIEGPTDEETLGGCRRTRRRDLSSWCGTAWWKWILVTFVGCWLMFAIGAALGMKRGIGACKPN